jgi:hypothetical protein
MGNWMSVGFETTELVRAGLVLLVASTMIAASSGEAAARHRKHIVRHHRRRQRVLFAEPTAPQAASLGAMRYYGGPKSPMWREVR